MKKSLYKKDLVLVIIALFVGANIIPSTVGTIEKKTTFTPASSLGYIQNLIDNADPGDTIYITSGTYYENIIINKSISLMGEDKDTTIIDGNGSGDVVYISADWVNISGFTIKSGSSAFYRSAKGINISSNYNAIFDNNISNNGYGIYLYKSSYNIITNNNIMENGGMTILGSFGAGIYLDTTFSNTIMGNTIGDNIHLGISLYNSSNNIISDNNIILNKLTGCMHTGACIDFVDSSCNNITGNNISSNDGNGISLIFSSNNTISGNNISNNNWSGIESYSSDGNIITSNTISDNGSPGISLSGSHNTIISNNISNNWDGIYFWGNNNTITDNTISNSKSGLSLTGDSNIIQKNNFLNNEQDAYFLYYRILDALFKKNRWKQNYWNESQQLPKRIHGEIRLEFGRKPWIITIPWFNIDWRPALNPYDIEV